MTAAIERRRARIVRAGSAALARGGNGALMLVTAVAILSVLIGGVAILHERASAKDRLRRAEIALAAAPGALAAVVGEPQALLAGEPEIGQEVAVNAILRRKLGKAIDRLNDAWHNPRARALQRDANVLDRTTARMMQLIDHHRLQEAGALDTFLEPENARVEADIARTNQQLEDEIAAADRAAWLSMLGVVIVAFVLLIALIVALADRRRGRLRVDAERDAHVESERRLKALVEHGSDMITVVTADTTVIYQTGAVERLLGYESSELVGAKMSDLLDPGDVPALLELCATARTASSELRLRHRDGSHRTCEVHATNLLGDPVWSGIVLNIWDLSERKALEERLRHQAFHDTLTGLPNRALVLDRAEQMLARARRSACAVAALYIDLDGFKHVNDSFGHAAGDELLKVIAQRLASVVRDQDTVGRLGGDEFIVVLEPGPDNVPAELVAQRLIEVLREPVEIEGALLATSASVGVASALKGSVDDLLRDADLALYEAKRTGRARSVVYHVGLQSNAHERISLQAELQRALDGGELFLLYQPTFDLHSRRMTGVEALLRWAHPSRGLITPDVFIPVAEETGLIVRIGRWVLHEATAQLAAWRAEGYEIGVAVNVSAGQLDEDGLESDVRAALRDTGIPAESLTLEITETALMRDVEEASTRLESLKKLGVRIAIDDFGTGHSSLAYLRRFPIDALKIDRSFVAGIASSRAAEAIIHTLVQLGKKLDIDTLAEGIETTVQLETLLSEHCDYGQGFLYAKPLDARSIEALLAAPGSELPRALVAG